MLIEDSIIAMCCCVVDLCDEASQKCEIETNQALPEKELLYELKA